MAGGFSVQISKSGYTQHETVRADGRFLLSVKWIIYDSSLARRLNWNLKDKWIATETAVSRERLSFSWKSDFFLDSFKVLCDFMVKVKQCTLSISWLTDNFIHKLKWSHSFHVSYPTICHRICKGLMYQDWDTCLLRKLHSHQWAYCEIFNKKRSKDYEWRWEANVLWTRHSFWFGHSPLIARAS